MTWNTCVLGGLKLPGLARVNVELEEALDVKKPQGGHGATITRQGNQPAKVSIQLRMWTPEQFAQFQALVPVLRPRVGGGRHAAPFAIVHPKTTLWGIRAVVLQRIRDHNGERGDLYDVDLECIEHFPPPKNIVATKTDKVPQYADILVDAPKPPSPPSKTGSKP